MGKGDEGSAAEDAATTERASQPRPVVSISVEWRKVDALRHMLFVSLSVVTGSLLPLVLFFYPVSRLRFRTTETLPELAEHAIVNVGDSQYVVGVEHHYTTGDSNEHIVVIEVNAQRFSASSIDKFAINRVDVVPANFIRFLSSKSSSSDNSVNSSSGKKKSKKKKWEEQELGEKRSRERDILLALYGPNTMKIPDVTLVEIFIYNALSPFFLFQYFAVGLWFYEDYILYSVLILVITMFAIYSNASEQVYNLERLKNLAGSESTVPLIGSSSDEGDMAVYTTPDSVLVPGDRFIVTSGLVLPCDCVLVKGRVVVDESMLTGESVPVTKVPIELGGVGGSVDATLTNASKSARGKFTIDGGDEEEIELATRRAGSVMFSGTVVRACQGQDAVAVVYRTGFRSAKGQLVASLLTPRDGFLTFFRDAFYIILFMVALTVTLYVYVAVILKSIGATNEEITIKFFDAITIAVPPGLSACLTVATAVCISRLKGLDIHVSDTSRVNWAGTVSAASFDKTGTLTQDSFDFQGAEVATSATTGDSASAGGPIRMVPFPASRIPSLPAVCLEVMATCQSLALLPGTNVPTGDFLEVELFRASGWSMRVGDDGAVISKPPGGGEPYSVLRHFEFNADRLRSATLLRRPDGSIAYLIKGSPEIIAKISDSESVPVDLQLRLKELTKRGFRVIAMAQKSFVGGSSGNGDLEGSTQEELEGGGGIEFLGLMYLSSKLKVDALSTIRRLRAADIQTNMITGDHIQTAIAVAVTCGIIQAPGSTIDTLYVIDEGPTGDVIVIDFYMDVAVHMKLEHLLDLAAASTLRESNTKNSLMQRLPKSADGPQSHEGRVQIAVTGRALQALQRSHSDEVVRDVIRYTSVFARTKPADKKSIVEAIMRTREEDVRLVALLGRQGQGGYATVSEGVNPMHHASSVDVGHSIPDQGSGDTSIGSFLQQRYGEEEDRGEYHVVYCGDGANDISALRAATVGVSLCDAATSVAAPVTSKKQEPGAVVSLLKEGRCSLITAYVLVLYNIMYGVIQLFMCVELYRYGLVAGSYMYLSQDLFFVLVLSLAISYTPPSHSLSTASPPKTFFTKYLMLKLFLQLVCFCIFQGVSLQVLSIQDWYSRAQTDDPLTETFSYEATTVDTMALAQLMIASVVSTIGEPFRKTWHTNKMHISALALQSAWVLYQLFGSDQAFYQGIMQLKPIPTSFAFTLLALMVLNLLVSVVLNEVADSFRAKGRSARYDKLLLAGGRSFSRGGAGELKKDEERLPLI